MLPDPRDWRHVSSRQATRWRIVLPYTALGVMTAAVAVVLIYLLVYVPLTTAFQHTLLGVANVVYDDLVSAALDHNQLLSAPSTSAAFEALTLDSAESVLGGLLDDSGVDAARLLDVEGAVQVSVGGGLRDRSAADGMEPLFLLAGAGGAVSAVRQVDETLWLVTSMTVGGMSSEPYAVEVAQQLNAGVARLAAQNEVDVMVVNADGQGLLFSAESRSPTPITVDAAAIDRALTTRGFVRIPSPAADEQLVISAAPLAVDAANRRGAVVADLPYVGSPLWQAQLLMSIVAGTLLVLGGLVGYRVGSRVGAPVETLVVSARQLVTQAAEERRATLASRDSLPLLAQQLDMVSAEMVDNRRLEPILRRYLGSTITTSILRNDTTLLTEQSVTATVLFADIRDFTALAEEVDLSDLHSELNEYYRMLIRVIRSNGGEVNKFGGDSVLAIFGAPVQLRSHASAAVTSAIRIMEELDLLNEQRISQGRPPFRVGIGVNTGEMLIGNFGSEQRLEYTVIGDCVNTAQRLSDLSKETPFYSIFLGERTRAELRPLPGWEIDFLGDKTLRGRRSSVRTYVLTSSESL